MAALLAASGWAYGAEPLLQPGQQTTNFAASSNHKWVDAMRNDCTSSQDECRQARVIYDDILRDARSAGKGLRQLRLVHEEVNHAIHYVADTLGGDVWKSPWTSFAEGDDCEGYATAKFRILRAAGWANRELRVITFHDHAVLIALLGTTWVMLDNKSPAVVPATTAAKYGLPVLALNEKDLQLYHPRR